MFIMEGSAVECLIAVHVSPLDYNGSRKYFKTLLTSSIHNRKNTNPMSYCTYDYVCSVHVCGKMQNQIL